MKRICTWVLLIGLVGVAGFAAVNALQKGTLALSAQIADSLEADVEAVRRCRAGLEQVLDHVNNSPDLFPPEKEQRGLPSLEDREEIRSTWATLMDYYLVLDDIRTSRGDFLSISQKQDRARSYHVYRAALLTEYRFALQFLERVEHTPACNVICNEAVPEMGLPAGTFDRFRLRFLNVLKAGEFVAAESVSRTFDDCPWPDLAGWTDTDKALILRYGVGKGEGMTVKNGLRILKTGGARAWLPIQKRVANWMGETRVRRKGEYWVSRTQIDGFADSLEPGDILLERREWYLTNVGIPGFWTHAAIYIGTPAQRTAYFSDLETRSWLAEHGADTLDDLLKLTCKDAWNKSMAPDENRLERRVVEAIAEGVVFTSLEYSAHCDSLAVLRPRLPRTDKAMAILRAFGYAGRPYDYGFDFLSDQALVCTELVYKSYEPGNDMTGLTLPKEKLMGHMVTPANAFARMADEEWGNETRQLELVLFLDGIEQEGRAEPADAETFRSTWKRPKWHVLLAVDDEKETDKSEEEARP